MHGCVYGCGKNQISKIYRALIHMHGYEWCCGCACESDFFQSHSVAVCNADGGLCFLWRQKWGHIARATKSKINFFLIGTCLQIKKKTKNWKNTDFEKITDYNRMICLYTADKRVCETGLEFAAWDSILRVLRLSVRLRVWVRLTLTLNIPQPLP